MNKSFLGYNKESVKTYDKVFKKSLLKKISLIWEKLIIILFIQEGTERGIL